MRRDGEVDQSDQQQHQHRQRQEHVHQDGIVGLLQWWTQWPAPRRQQPSEAEASMGKPGEERHQQKQHKDFPVDESSTEAASAHTHLAGTRSTILLPLPQRLAADS